MPWTFWLFAYLAVGVSIAIAKVSTIDFSEVGAKLRDLSGVWFAFGLVLATLALGVMMLLKSVLWPLKILKALIRFA